MKKNKALNAAGKKVRQLQRQWNNRGGKKYCVVCGSHVVDFRPGGQEEEVFEHHHVIGGGRREGKTV